jgi:hypothetical protein
VVAIFAVRWLLSSGAVLSLRRLRAARESVKERFGSFQISGLETFGEAVVDRLEERPRVSGTGPARSATGRGSWWRSAPRKAPLPASKPW